MIAPRESGEGGETRRSHWTKFEATWPPGARASAPPDEEVRGKLSHLHSRKLRSFDEPPFR